MSNDVSRRGFLKIFGIGIGSFIVLPNSLFKRKKEIYYDDHPDYEDLLDEDVGFIPCDYTLEIICKPDKKLKKIIKRNFRNGKSSCNMLINFTYRDNYQITRAKSNEMFDGIIREIKRRRKEYFIKVDVLSISDKENHRWTPKRLRRMSYSGNLTLRDGIHVNKDDNKKYGCVIAVDKINRLADVFF